MLPSGGVCYLPGGVCYPLGVCVTHLGVCVTHLGVCVTHPGVCVTHLGVCVTSPGKKTKNNSNLNNLCNGQYAFRSRAFSRASAATRRLPIG